MRRVSGGTAVYLHREIMQPGDLVVDHIFGDRIDNRRPRMRVTTEQVNAQKNIINLLLNGTSQRDAAFEVERAKASEVIERMMTTRNEINRIRSEIDET